MSEVSDLKADVLMLRQENKELRELAKHLNTCNYYTSIECANVHCHECPYDNNTGNCDFDRRLREHGVTA